MATRQNLYIGKSGQLVVMAEFLVRGYNVAVPEVDIGDDMFVVRDVDANLWRIQVKTANSQTQKRGYSARFLVPLNQLNTPTRPDLYYVFVVRDKGQWKEFIIINRTALKEAHTAYKIGTVAKNNLSLHFSFNPTDAICSTMDFQEYRNNWNHWPEINN